MRVKKPRPKVKKAAWKYAPLLRLEDFPIPHDIGVREEWPPIIAEIAEHVGARNALLIVDRFAGQDVCVPIEPELSPFAGLLSRDCCTKLALVFGRERLAIPTGYNTLLHARRQRIIATIRAGKLSVTYGAAILRTARRHLATVVSGSDEGIGFAPFETLPEPRQLIALRAAAEIAADALSELGASAAYIDVTKAKIIEIFTHPLPDMEPDQ